MSTTTVREMARSATYADTTEQKLNYIAGAIYELANALDALETKLDRDRQEVEVHLSPQ
jgi:hypothetical protein